MSDGADSRLVDQEGNGAETEEIGAEKKEIGGEIRNYELNIEKSKQKKLEATTRDNIKIFPSGDGHIIFFNYLIYQLIKESADKYYASKECEVIHAKDKQGSLVDTHFKMKSGKQNLYTLSMYHTKCKCLVNGEKAIQFLQEDLPRILETVEPNLQQERGTVDEMNKNIRLYCASVVPEIQKKVCDKHGNELKAPASDVQNVRKNRQTLNKKDTTISDTHCDCLCSVKDQLNKINEVVEVLRNELQRHMKSTNEQIGEIKGNIVSLEKQYQVYSMEIQSKVDAVSDTTSAIKEKFEVANEDLSRKLQSISDTLK